MSANFCRRTQHERAWRNFHPESNEGVSADNGTCAHLHVIKNDRAHSDKDFIVDLAGVYDGAMTDGDELSYGCWISGVEMDDGIVLNVRARPDDDTVDIAA